MKCNDGVTKFSNGARMASFVPKATLYVRAVESSGKVLLVSTEPIKQFTPEESMLPMCIKFKEDIS